MDATPMLDEVVARLEAHEAEGARLRAEVAALRSSAPPPEHVGGRAGGAPDDGSATTSRPRREVDRRRLLRGAAAAAGVAVVGGAIAVGPAAPAAAATVVGSGNPGVRGDGIGGDGVQGNTNQAGSSGVYGNSSTVGAVGITGRHLSGGTAIEGIVSGSGTTPSVGVRGLAPGYGVIGHSTVPGDSIGVYGYSAGVGGGFIGTVANLLLPANAAAAPPPSQTTSHTQGMVLTDKDGALWYCAASGAPGTWREVAGPTTAGSLHLLASTTRVYDSRPDKQPLTVVKGQLSNGEDRTISCATWLPVRTTGVLVNVTVTETSPAGWLAAYPGPTWPGNSSINWAAENTTIANGATVLLASDRSFEVKCSAGSYTHVVVDLIGYYR